MGCFDAFVNPKALDINNKTINLLALFNLYFEKKINKKGIENIGDIHQIVNKNKIFII